jgi:hypothetical protein
MAEEPRRGLIEPGTTRARSSGRRTPHALSVLLQRNPVRLDVRSTGAVRGHHLAVVEEGQRAEARAEVAVKEEGPDRRVAVGGAHGS